MTEALPLGCLDERYGRLRIVKPTAERAVRESVRRLGQLMPIVVCERREHREREEREAVFAVVDGFKRLAAARSLGLPRLRARVMALNETAAIAALVSLNRAGRGMSDLEEALVVRVLCRERGLEQRQVAELLGRHKSWVCRRLSLAERLADVVADDVRAGLVSSTMARELSRLPRGNQGPVATAIRRACLTSREAAKLVTLVTRSSGLTQQRYLLEHPREALEAHGERPAQPAADPRLGPRTQKLRRGVWAAIRVTSDLAARLDDCAPCGWTAGERQVLGPLLGEARQTTELLLGKLTDAAEAAEAEEAEEVGDAN